MKSVNQNLVFRQLISNLPENILACPLKNYDAKKITDLSIVKAFISRCENNILPKKEIP